MKLTQTPIDGALVLEPKVFGDKRGFFLESYNARTFEEVTGKKAPQWVQDNHSKSSKGVLRGLHFQLEHTQSKLLRCISGSVFDVIVDLRESSKSFGQWYGLVLSSENQNQIFMPKGVAHGFLVLSESAEILYKVDEYFHPKSEVSLLWNDPQIKISWPLGDLCGTDVQLSDKDEKGLLFSKCPKFS